MKKKQGLHFDTKRFPGKRCKRRAVRHAFALTAALVLAGLCAGCSRAGTWEMHVREELLRVEGLEGEYTLLFLTDTHMVVMDGEAGEQEAENQESRHAMFRNEEGVPSAEQFSRWIQYANETQVDGVLLGGDIIDTPSDSNLEWLESQLSLLQMPYLYVNGNHDWTYPWEYMTDTARNVYLPALEPFMQGNTAIQKLDLGELVVVGIDDSTNQVEGSALPEYESFLQEGKPVIVMVHVPFMTQSVLGRSRELWNSPVVIGAGNFGGYIPMKIPKSLCH